MRTWPSTSPSSSPSRRPTPGRFRPRRWRQELKTYLERFGKPVTACETVAQGVALAKQLAGPDGVVLAYGSLYMVGDIEDAARA